MESIFSEIGDGFLYMVMEFGSTDLCKLMNKKKLIPLEVAAYWNGILNAILYIHSNGEDFISLSLSHLYICVFQM